MFQRQELSLKIYFVIVFSRITTCRETIMYAVIGKQAQLDFSYPCDSTEITLQHSYLTPFYNSNNSSSVLDPPNYGVENQNDTASDECSLHLTINPVSRDDEGTYILIPYKNGAVLPDYPRIGLRVDHPPGKASCEISNDYNYAEWVSLQCTAPVGTLPGQILCYQNGMTLPKWTEPTEIDGNLNQIILARLDGVFYCCSSILTGMKDKCNCTDWGWDPIRDSVSDIADPCPQAMSTEDPTSTHIFTNSSSSNLVTELPKYLENHKNNSYWKVICALITVISVLAIINVSIACTFTCTYRRKAKELARLQSSIKPESIYPCLPANGKEVLEHNV